MRIVSIVLHAFFIAAVITAGLYTAGALLPVSKVLGFACLATTLACATFEVVAMIRASE